MPSKPYEPREPVLKTLFAYSNNVCSFADPNRGRFACEEQLTNPGWKRVKGRVCHIRGERPGSARYDESMTDESRRSYDNLILLCPNHHTLIDDLEPDQYTVELLEEMKVNALARQGDVRWASECELERFARDALLEYRRTVAAATQPEDDIGPDMADARGFVPDLVPQVVPFGSSVHGPQIPPEINREIEELIRHAGTDIDTFVVLSRDRIQIVVDNTSNITDDVRTRVSDMLSTVGYGSVSFVPYSD